MIEINYLIEVLKPYYDFKFNDNSRKFNESEERYAIREETDNNEKYNIITNPDSDSVLLYRIKKHEVFCEDQIQVKFDSKDSLEIKLIENSPEHRRLIYFINRYNRLSIDMYELLINVEDIPKSDYIKITISCPRNVYTINASCIKDFIDQARRKDVYYYKDGGYNGCIKDPRPNDIKYFDTKYADECRTEREENISNFLFLLLGFVTGIEYPNPVK